MTDKAIREWDSLSPDEQLALREAYGHHLDTLPPTCDLSTKLERYQQWLAGRGVKFSPPT